MGRGLGSILILAWGFWGCEMTVDAVDGDEPSRILMQEEFAANGFNWFVGTVPGAYNFEITDGEYFLRSLNDSGIAVSKSVPIPESGGFDVRAALHLYSTREDLGYGFCWGGNEADDRFCFFISKDKRYTLFKREGGIPSDLVPWTVCARIDGSRNVLEIRKRGNTLRYSINGKEEGALPFEPFFGNRLLFAGDGVQDFAVDELTIRVP